MIYMIAARARNGVIGNKGKVPWNLPADVAFFRSHVTGKTVIMGKNVYLSFMEISDIAAHAIVITSDASVVEKPAQAADSLESALELSKKYGPDAWIIGGGYTYQTAMPYADGIYLTEIDADYQGDVSFPVLDSSWRLVSSDLGHDASFNKPFSFNFYRKQA